MFFMFPHLLLRVQHVLLGVVDLLLPHGPLLGGLGPLLCRLGSRLFGGGEDQVLKFNSAVGAKGMSFVVEDFRSSDLHTLGWDVFQIFCS